MEMKYSCAQDEVLNRILIVPTLHSLCLVFYDKDKIRTQSSSLQHANNAWKLITQHSSFTHRYI